MKIFVDELPKICTDCPLYEIQCPDDEYDPCNRVNKSYKRPEDCPLCVIDDAEPVVHGHWIDSVINGFDRCSNCKTIWDVSLTRRNKLFRHCPGCGALMDVIQKHGYWVFNENDGMFYCTNCKNGSASHDYPYCHWCGAIIDGVKVKE